jgi:hypothetical protein
MKMKVKICIQLIVFHTYATHIIHTPKLAFTSWSQNLCCWTIECPTQIGWEKHLTYCNVYCFIGLFN